MLNIVLPMAGLGSRFSRAGYKVPKPFINVCGKPMIQVVVENLRPKVPHRFIFICRHEHIVEYNADTLLRNITAEPIIISVEKVTDGQLSSAMLAEEFIDNDQPLLTANTDQYIDFKIDNFLDRANEKNLDGLIMTMEASDPKWSYVRLDPDTNLVTETAEKKVISNEATVGIYYFKRGREFVKSGRVLVHEDKRVNGEFYICPVYNYMINEGKRIGIYNIGREQSGMYGLGTPEDLKLFLSHPISKEL